MLNFTFINKKYLITTFNIEFVEERAIKIGPYQKYRNTTLQRMVV